jgi:hypothetical protein
MDLLLQSACLSSLNEYEMNRVLHGNLRRARVRTRAAV